MQRLRIRQFRALFLTGMLFTWRSHALHAADHLDTPTVIADPAADIGDLFAWTSSDGRRLNMAITLVAHRFSDQLQYVFHVDSGGRFGETTMTTPIVCRFDTGNTVECWAGDADHLRGDASKAVGLEGRNRRFRVFAGLRNDPFFNNVRGTRAALGRADAALKGGTKVDASGCSGFDSATTKAIFDHWRHTDGGRPTNLLAGWKSASLVMSIDLDVVNAGGRLLAVWAAVHKPPSSALTAGRTLGAPIERIGRPLTGNGLLGPLAPDDVSDARKEAYNRADPSEWAQFAPDIALTLGLYDGFDGICGNQWLAAGSASRARYGVLAKTLADDRLWINSKSTVCTQYLAVERTELADLAEVAIAGSPGGDCGGRTPNYDAIDMFRSLLVLGKTTGVDDGVEGDDAVHSTTEFPFLAAP